MNGIQFVTDAKGRKVAVLIDLKKHGVALEDFSDGLISESRRNEKSIPYGQYRATRLKRAPSRKRARKTLRAVSFLSPPETCRARGRPPLDGYSHMPCLFLIVILAFPRLAIALLFLFTHYLDRAFQSILLLILGFIFLPFTTLVYAWLVNSHLPLAGINLLWIVIAVLVDLGSVGHGYSRRRA
jgi:hypothetical protein